MLFHVEMTVNLPVDIDPVKAAALKAEERRSRSGCSAKACGDICGASRAAMRTSASSTSRAPRTCTTC